MFENGLGIGAMIRNAAREVMVALSARGAALSDSEEAEALACRKSMEFAIIEGDNVTIISVVSSSSPNWSHLGVIYDDIGCLAIGLRYVVLIVLDVVPILWPIP